jgi:hypothetical protein
MSGDGRQMIAKITGRQANFSANSLHNLKASVRVLAEVVSFTFAVIILRYTSGFVLLADKDD